MALHDRLEGLARRPPPEPPLPPLPSLTVEELLSEIRTVMGPAPETPLPAAPPPAPAAAPAGAPAAPAAPARQPTREVKVVSVPAGGWVFVEGNAPVAVALDPTGAGQALATLLGATAGVTVR